MEWFSSVDWHGMFVPDKPLLEIFIRGSVVYLSLFFMLRFILKRQMGSIGIGDLLVIVLIADASQNAMATDYNSLPDGIMLVATLIFWNCIIEWLGFHFPTFERIINPQPLPLIHNGKIIRKNLEKELISEEELMTQLRLQGIEKVGQVKQACLEGDGKISVLERGKTHNRRRKPPETTT